MVCQKTGGLSYCFVNSELRFGAGNFAEKFQAFFFSWRLNADAAISADVNSVVSFLFDRILQVVLYLFSPLAIYLNILCTFFYILNVI